MAEELREISNEELKEILEAHKLWLDTSGNEGKRADLSYCNLMEKNLRRANLQVADLRGSNLQGANLRRANLLGAKLEKVNLLRADLLGADLREVNLWRADLRGADLRGAKFQGAHLWDANIRWANYTLDQFAKLPNKNLPETILFQRQLDNVQKELTAARAEGNSEKIAALEQQVRDREQRLQNLEQALEEQLKDRIGDAKRSLENSLKTTKNRIDRNIQAADQTNQTAQCFFAFSLCLTIVIPLLFYCMKPSDSIKQIGQFAALFYTLPVVATLLIATTLLRHHKKLQDEIRHFSDQQQRIELYSGLLEAAQHAAAALSKDNNQAAEQLVEETFKAIRDSLLKEQAAAASQNDNRDDHSPLLDKLTDITGKLAEAAVKTDGKN